MIFFQHKLSGNDPSEKTEEDFQSSADIDFYIDRVRLTQNKSFETPRISFQEIIYIADTKITRRYSDYLVKQILKYEEVTDFFVRNLLQYCFQLTRVIRETLTSRFNGNK